MVDKTETIRTIRLQCHMMTVAVYWLSVNDNDKARELAPLGQRMIKQSAMVMQTEERRQLLKELTKWALLIHEFAETLKPYDVDAIINANPELVDKVLEEAKDHIHTQSLSEIFKLIQVSDITQN